MKQLALIAIGAAGMYFLPRVTTPTPTPPPPPLVAVAVAAARPVPVPVPMSIVAPDSARYEQRWHGMLDPDQIDGLTTTQAEHTRTVIIR